MLLPSITIVNVKPPRKGLMYVEPDRDRRLISANDWYAFGFVAGISGVAPDPSIYVRWYCGKSGAFEQYWIGRSHGRRLKKESETTVELKA